MNTRNKSFLCWIIIFIQSFFSKLVCLFQHYLITLLCKESNIKNILHAFSTTETSSGFFIDRFADLIILPLIGKNTVIFPVIPVIFVQTFLYIIQSFIICITTGFSYSVILLSLVHLFKIPLFTCMCIQVFCCFKNRYFTYTTYVFNRIKVFLFIKVLSTIFMCISSFLGFSNLFSICISYIAAYTLGLMWFFYLLKDVCIYDMNINNSFMSLINKQSIQMSIINSVLCIHAVRANIISSVYPDFDMVNNLFISKIVTTLPGAFFVPSMSYINALLSSQKSKVPSLLRKLFFPITFWFTFTGSILLIFLPIVKGKLLNISTSYFISLLMIYMIHQPILFIFCILFNKIQIGGKFLNIVTVSLCRFLVYSGVFNLISFLSGSINILFAPLSDIISDTILTLFLI